MLDRGFDAERNTFTQHYDTTEVDASLLVLPLVGFIAGDDPRMLGTIEAIEQDLMRDGLLLRYRTETGVDGLAGDEHPFLACSFWLVSAYAEAGRRDDAEALFDRSAGSPTTSACSPRSTTPRRPDGRQLPAGVQPPGAGAGGAPAALLDEHGPLAPAAGFRLRRAFSCGGLSPAAGFGSGSVGRGSGPSLRRTGRGGASCGHRPWVVAHSGRLRFSLRRACPDPRPQVAARGVDGVRRWSTW